MKRQIENLRTLVEAFDNTLLHLGDRMTPADRHTRRLLVEEGRAAVERLECAYEEAVEFDHVMTSDERAPDGDDYNALWAILEVGGFK